MPSIIPDEIQNESDFRAWVETIKPDRRGRIRWTCPDMKPCPWYRDRDSRESLAEIRHMLAHHRLLDRERPLHRVAVWREFDGVRVAHIVDVFGRVACIRRGVHFVKDEECFLAVEAPVSLRCTKTHCAQYWRSIPSPGASQPSTIQPSPTA